jgi:hypothetical protein
MGVISIKDPTHDYQAKVDSTGHLLVTSGSTGGDVNIFDSAGNPLTSTGGALNVNIGGITANSILVYNEQTSVAVGIETTIATYTAPVGKLAYLLWVFVAGQNVGQWKIYNNASVYDQKYTSASELNENFDFQTGLTSVPGQLIAVGNTLSITVNQIGLSPANFNARIQILEIG